MTPDLDVCASCLSSLWSQGWLPMCVLPSLMHWTSLGRVGLTRVRGPGLEWAEWPLTGTPVPTG